MWLHISTDIKAHSRKLSVTNDPADDRRTAFHLSGNRLYRRVPISKARVSNPNSVYSATPVFV